MHLKYFITSNIWKIRSKSEEENLFAKICYL